MGFLKLGAGTLTLGGLNTYSGPTTISLGTMIAAGSVTPGSAGVFGSSTAAIALGDANTAGGTVQLLISGANTIGANIVVGPTASPTLGNVDDNNAVFGGTIALSNSLSIASASIANTLTFAGSIAGNQRHRMA